MMDRSRGKCVQCARIGAVNVVGREGIGYVAKVESVPEVGLRMELVGNGEVKRKRSLVTGPAWPRGFQEV